MPQKKYYRRRYRRTKPRRKVNIRAVVNKQITKYLDKQSETKALDVVNTTTVSTSGSVITQPLPTKGDESYNREGNQIEIKSFYLLINFYWSAASTPDTHNVLRVIFFCDRLNRGQALPTVSDVIQNTTYGIISPLKRESAGRYHILLDRLLYINDADHRRAVKKFYFKFKKPKPQEYDEDNTGTYTQLRNEGYFLILISDSSLVDHPSVDYYIRMLYKDM